MSDLHVPVQLDKKMCIHPSPTLLREIFSQDVIYVFSKKSDIHYTYAHTRVVHIYHGINMGLYGTFSSKTELYKNFTNIAISQP